MRHFSLLVLGACLSLASFAEEVVPKIDTIASKIYGADRRVLIFTPSNISQGTKLSVIYTLDSDTLFVDMAQNIEMASNSQVVPSAVVAIDYFRAERKLDKGFNDKTMELNADGEKFYRYINEELVPHIDSILITSGFNTLVAFERSATYLSTYLARNNKNFSSYLLICPQKLEAKSFANGFINEDTTKIIRIMTRHDGQQVVDTNSIRLEKIYRDAGFTNVKIDTIFRADSIDVQDVNYGESMGTYQGLVSIYDRYITLRSLSENNVQKTDCWDAMLEASAKNESLYKQPYAPNFNNFESFLSYAVRNGDYISIEKFINHYYAILTTYDNADATNAMAQIMTKYVMVRRAEQLFLLAIERYENAGRARYTMNARIAFACDLLAKHRAQYERAWDVLEQGKQICAEDSLVYGYYQGTISALYGYNLELGERYLLDAHNNIDAMPGTFITQNDTHKHLDMLNEQKKAKK